MFIACSGYRRALTPMHQKRTLAGDVVLLDRLSMITFGWHTGSVIEKAVCRRRLYPGDQHPDTPSTEEGGNVDS